MTIEQLSEFMGRSVAETAAFVACLRVFTDKGHSVEQAIELSDKAWHTLLNNFNDAINSSHTIRADAGNALATMAVEWFYPGGAK